MIIDISKLLVSEGSALKIDKSVSFESELFNDSDISINTPVKLYGEIKSAASMLYLTLEVSTSYSTECARCLKNITRDISFAVNEVFSKPGLEHENDDVIILDSNEINLKEIIEQALSCALPITSLCSDECKGLCPVCGCNLNIEMCSCETDDIDPRLAVLKDFLK